MNLVNGKAIRVTDLDRLWVFQEVEAPRFQDSRYMKVVRLSALRTGYLYPQEISLVLISVRGWVDPKALVRRKDYAKKKNPIIPSGIETVTFRLVAQCVNHLHTSCPHWNLWLRKMRGIKNHWTLKRDPALWSRLLRRFCIVHTSHGRWSGNGNDRSLTVKERCFFPA